MTQGQAPVLPYHNEFGTNVACPPNASQAASREKDDGQQTNDTASGCSSSPASVLNAPPGYPKLAELMNILPETSVFRRFGTLNSLNLLYLQAELTDIEHKLRRAQVEDHTTKEGFKRLYAKNWYFLQASAQDGDDKQLQLIALAREKLDNYSKWKDGGIRCFERVSEYRLTLPLRRCNPDPTRKDPFLQTLWYL